MVVMWCNDYFHNNSCQLKFDRYHGKELVWTRLTVHAKWPALMCNHLKFFYLFFFLVEVGSVLPTPPVHSNYNLELSVRELPVIRTRPRAVRSRRMEIVICK